MTITSLKERANNNMFWINFRLCLKQNKKILIVISILQLLGLPLMSLIFTIAEADAENVNELSLVFFILISIFCIGVSIFCGIIIAVNNFNYLHKKSQVDMVYSLPIKRKYKFLSDFFSGLAVYTVPYVAACILSNLILLAGGVCVDDINELISDTSFIALDVQCEFAGLLMMILGYTLTVLILNCCGTLFESIMNTLIINLLIPGAIAVIAAMFFADIYGVSIMETIMPILGYTSPIGGIIYLIYMFVEGINYYSASVGCIAAGVFGKWAVFFLLFTVLVFFLSMYLYMRRKAEDVSKPYVYKLLYYMVITTIVMAISLIARFDIAAIIPVIIFSFIVYLIFEVITNRGFKKFYKSLIRYSITMFSVLIVCIIAVATDGFGVESRIPSASAVKSVRIDYKGFDRTVLSNNHYVYDNYIYNNLNEKKMLVYDQEEIIEKVIDVHKDAVELYQSGEYDELMSGDNYNDENYYNYDGGVSRGDYPNYEIEFIYNLKTGSTLKRTYTLTFKQIKELFILDSTPQMSEFYETALMKSFDSGDYRTGKIKKSYCAYISNFVELSSTEYTIYYAQCKEIAQAYKKDYENMTLNQMLTDDIYCYINEFAVRKSFKNTIECLKKNKLSVPLINKFDFTYFDAVLYPPSDVICFGSDGITSTFGPYEFKDASVKVLSSSQVIELLERGMLKKTYYADDECYMVVFNGDRYVIPNEFRDYARDLMTKTTT